jgi:hypothetical protein
MNNLHRLGAGIMAVLLVTVFVGLVAVGSSKRK